MVPPSRREFLPLALSAVSASLAGCFRDDSDGGTPTETPPGEVTESGCWPSMCAGTQIIEVDVNSAFSGTAVLEASCRDDPLDVSPGESADIVREVDAESCGVTLFLDDEQVYSDNIEGHTSVTVRVRSNGNIDVETVLL